jgi:hypothetical protein
MCMDCRPVWTGDMYVDACAEASPLGTVPSVGPNPPEQNWQDNQTREVTITQHFDHKQACSLRRSVLS